MNKPNRTIEGYQTRTRVRKARKYLANRCYLSEIDVSSTIGKLTFHIPDKMSDDQAYLLMNLAFNGMEWQ